MKSRSHRLKPAADVAGTRERDAARVWGEGMRVLAANEEKLTELQSYHDQYANKFSSASATGMGAAQMQEYRGFLSRINDAIREQKRIIEGLKHTAEQQRQVWLQKRTRVHAIEKVLERCHSDEQKLVEKNEQRVIDDRRPRK